MTTHRDRLDEPADAAVPLGQRIYENWLLLMIAGIAIMAIVYTGWGLWEVFTMPEATLP